MPGNESDPTQRFSSRVENYVRYRPSYPAAVIEVLQREIGLLPVWELADAGCGTGISAELFLRNGNTVYAVEPNAPMRRAAEGLLAGYEKFYSVAGTAEATTLDAESVDAVVAAQAFHWFDVPAAAAEARRILKPRGWGVVLWNTRRLASTPFLRGYEALLVEHGIDYAQVRHDRGERARLLEYFGGEFTTRTLDNRQELDLDALRGRLLSSSYVPGPEAAGHGAFMRAADALFHDHQRQGVVTIEYDTEIHFGRLA